MAAPHNDNIKNKIIETTTQLLSERSFAEISIADIAKKTGITKGSIYYYYNSKDDLLYEIADFYLEKLFSDLLTWVNNKEKDTSLARLLRYTFQRGLDDPGKNLRLHLTINAIDGNEYLRTKLIERYEEFKTIYSQKLSERKNKNGEFQARLIITIVDGLLLQKLLHNDNFDINSFIEDFIQFYEKAK